MQAFIDSFSGFIGAVLILPLIGTGLYLTIRLKLVQLVRFGHSWKVIAGVYDNPDDEGDINHLQALSAALSATIGIGNIAGVATAIHFGGLGQAVNTKAGVQRFPASAGEGGWTGLGGDE